MTSEIGTNTFLRKMFSSPWKRLAVCVSEKNSCSAVFFSTLRFLKKFGQGRPRAGGMTGALPSLFFQMRSNGAEVPFHK